MKGLCKVYLLVLFSFMTACSNGGDGGHVDTIKFDNKEDAQQSKDELEVNCADEENCPSYVGGLVFFGQRFNSYQIGVCSQTLISPTQILTNRHCLMDRDWESASCSEFEVYFPKTKTLPEEVVKCKKVLQLSDFSVRFSTDSVSVPDWAVLELVKPVNRTPIRLNTTEGIINKEIYKVYPVYYDKIDIESRISGEVIPVAKGKIKSIKCEGAYNHIMNNHYFDTHSALFASACSEGIIQGNSGSGFINQNNELVGAISFGAAREIKTEIFGKAATITNKHVSGTNLSCVEHFNGVVSEFCYFNPEDKNYTSVGNLLSIASGALVSEDSRREYDQLLDPTVAMWEDFNVDTYRQINNPDGIGLATLATQPLLDVLNGFTEKENKGKTPLCIQPGLKNSAPFTFIWPVYDHVLSEIAVDLDLFIEVPVKVRSLEFEMVFDPVLNKFEGEPVEISDQALSATHKAGLDQVLVEFQSCVLEGRNANCGDMLTRKASLDELKISSGVRDSLFMNQKYFNSPQNSSNGYLSLPACTK